MSLLVRLAEALKNGDETMILKLPHNAKGATTRLFGNNGGPTGTVLQDGPTVAEFKTAEVQAALAKMGMELTYG